MSFRIGHIWAWTQVGDDDEEGICAFMNDGIWTPMIASDRVRVDDLRAWARVVAGTTGRPVTLRLFAAGEVIETVEP